MFHKRHCQLLLKVFGKAYGLGYFDGFVDVFDYLVGRMSRLFRFHNYSPFEKVYAAMLFVAGLSLRDVITRTSRESVRCWVHRMGKLFTPERRCKRLAAVDETVKKVFGCRVYSG